jgi:hypothetical protein
MKPIQNMDDGARNNEDFSGVRELAMR